MTGATSAVPSFVTGWRGPGAEICAGASQAGPVSRIGVVEKRARRGDGATRAMIAHVDGAFGQ
jgi:hypothetical protein